tara:strand:+ start:303 stop:2036 length:1734 start_codon:yes stop_codon:yes gene_type:complete
MIKDFKKIRALLAIEQKRALIILSGLLLIGMFFEILGLGMLLPILTILLNPAQLSEVFVHINFVDLDVFSYNDIVVFCLFSLFFIYVIKTFFLVFITYKQNVILENIGISIQNKLFSKQLFRPYKDHLYRDFSDIIKDIQVEVVFFISFCSSLITLLVEAALVISILATILYLEPRGAIAIGAIFGVLSLFFLQLSKKKLNAWGESREILDGKILKTLTDSLSGIKEVKLLHKEDYFINTLKENNSRKAKVSIYFQTLSQIPRFYLELITIIGMICLILVLFYNGVETTQIVTLLGVFVAAAFRMIPSVNRILSALQNIKYYEATVNKIYNQIIGFDFSRSNKNVKQFEFCNEIKLDNIQFSYKNQIILNSINLEIKKGTTVGIIGASGSGKSTLVDLINGLLKPSRGKISVDGKNINEIIKPWQLSIGYVGQEIFLIDDTIKSNIAFGMSSQEIKIERVYKALEAAQLSVFINELELGIETKVGERGVQLSGGQKQRIGIARALYHNPSVLIFDEATASLDDETERQVMNSIYNLKQNKTMIIIAHRISTLDDCDMVYEVKNGKIKLKELEWTKIS